MTGLAGKVVVVTGAGSGIGRALALAAAGHGARLALSDIDEAGLAETVRLLVPPRCGRTGSTSGTGRRCRRTRRRWRRSSTRSTAKFAVRGFTESVRQEMLVARHPVRVSCAHPGGVRTSTARNGRVAPGQDQAALADFFDNRLARTSAGKAAEVILAGMLAGKPRILVGADAKLLDALVRLLGGRYQRLVATAVARVVAPRTGLIRPGATTARGGASADG